MDRNGRSRSPLQNGRPQSSQAEKPYHQQWADVLSQDWERLEEAPAEIRGDPGLVGVAMRASEGQALQFASDELRGDTEYLGGAAEELGVAVLQHASDSAKADEDFIMQVVEFCAPADVLPWVSDEVRNKLLSEPDFVREAVQGDGVEVLQYVPAELLGDREFMLSLSDQVGGEVLNFATAELQAELSHDREYLLQTVANVGAPDVLEDAAPELRADRGFILQCATHTSLEEVLPYASAEIRAELDPEGKIQPHPSLDWSEQAEEEANGVEAEAAAELVDISSEEEAEEEMDPETLRASLLQAVQDAGVQALEQAPPYLRGDRLFILEASRLHSPHEVINYASPEIREQLYADASFVMRLLPHGREKALSKASLSLRGDRQFMKAAEQYVPLKNVMGCASAPLRIQLSKEPDFVLRLLRGSREKDGLRFAAPDLLKNPKFLRLTLKSKLVSIKEVLERAGPEARVELCSDSELMTQYVKEAGIKSLEHASYSLRRDLGFMLGVVQITSQPNAVMEYAAQELRELIAS